MTRICVFGAGAIGGYVGARLALKGEADVSLVARGARERRAESLGHRAVGAAGLQRPLAQRRRPLAEPPGLGIIGGVVAHHVHQGRRHRDQHPAGRTAARIALRFGPGPCKDRLHGREVSLLGGRDRGVLERRGE